ncbi:MAG: hypothetical protein WC761_02040 [Candidatus Paceibacterota bacterium]|jgi:hypothetical protein
MALFQIWRDHSGVSCVTEKAALDLKERGLISHSAILLHQFHAENMLQSGRLYYKYMGYGEYRPMLDKRGKIQSFYFDPIDD